MRDHTAIALEIKDAYLTTGAAKTPGSIYCNLGQKEVHLYGSARLGIDQMDRNTLFLTPSGQYEFIRNPFSANMIIYRNLPSLFSTLSAETTPFDIVRYYSLRWRIERFHYYVLKTGALNVEDLRFDDVHTIRNAIALCCIVAWKIMHLTYWVRQAPEMPPEVCSSETELIIIQSKSRIKITTLRQAIIILAKFVGFEPSKNYPMPGIKKLANALQVLNQYVNGFELAQSLNNSS